MDKEELHEIDKHAGQKLKQAMQEAGYTQTTLANQCGVTFQQIQKYIRGTNRISVSRLYQIAGILEKPIWYFFPKQCGGDMAKYALRFEEIIKRYRDKEDRILAILTE